MSSSTTWGLLLLAGLCYPAPASLAEGLQGDAAQGTDVSKHDHESPSHRIAPDLADFAFRFYRQVAHRSNTSNIFFSPVSIATAFAMLSLGAKGNTLTQILEGINFNLKKVSKADVHIGLHHLLDSLNEYQPHVQYQMVSKLLIHENRKPTHTFLEHIRRLYNSEVLPVNFRDVESKRKMNNYIEKETQGKFVDLVKELDKDTTLALVNYVIFHGKWKDKFKAERMVEEDFHVDQKSTVRVPMTHRVGFFRLHRDQELSCWVLLQRYWGHICGLLVLPDPGKMQQLEARLSPKHLSDILRAIDQRSASLHLPKLSISGTYDLKTTLSGLGITKVFSDRAELSGISEGAPLKLSKALHKAVLSVEENGSGHSGATLSEESAWSRHLAIKFNRPFLVIVMDEKTNIPLFVGKMVNPKQK